MFLFFNKYLNIAKKKLKSFPGKTESSIEVVEFYYTYILDWVPQNLIYLDLDLPL